MSSYLGPIETISQPVTLPYTATFADALLVVQPGTSGTLTLPGGNGSAKGYRLVVANLSGSSITVAGNGRNILSNGASASTVTLQTSAALEFIAVLVPAASTFYWVANGTNWTANVTTGNLTTSGVVSAANGNATLKWDSTNGVQIYDGLHSVPMLQQGSSTNQYQVLTGGGTTLDNGSGNMITKGTLTVGAVGATQIATITGNLTTWGDLSVGGKVAGALAQASTYYATGGSYTLAYGVSWTNNSGVSLTLPTGQNGASLYFYNASAGNVTVTAPANVNIYWGNGYNPAVSVPLAAASGYYFVFMSGTGVGNWFVH